jgi:hypothetical protein
METLEGFPEMWNNESKVRFALDRQRELGPMRPAERTVAIARALSTEVIANKYGLAEPLARDDARLVLQSTPRASAEPAPGPRPNPF